MAVNLKLHDERGAQLRLIAKARGVTMAQVIEEAIQREIDAGTIPADLPGVTVAKTGNAVKIEMSDFTGEASAVEAAKLADSLREAGEASADVARKKRWLEGMGALTGIKVERMAHGIRLISPLTGKKYPLTFSVASDLAEQIKREAK